MSEKRWKQIKNNNSTCTNMNVHFYMSYPGTPGLVLCNIFCMWSPGFKIKVIYTHSRIHIVLLLVLKRNKNTWKTSSRSLCVWYTQNFFLVLQYFFRCIFTFKISHSHYFLPNSARVHTSNFYPCVCALCVFLVVSYFSPFSRLSPSSLSLSPPCSLPYRPRHFLSQFTNGTFFCNCIVCRK